MSQNRSLFIALAPSHIIPPTISFFRIADVLSEEVKCIPHSHPHPHPHSAWLHRRKYIAAIRDTDRRFGVFRISHIPPERMIKHFDLFCSSSSEGIMNDRRCDGLVHVYDLLGLERDTEWCCRDICCFKLWSVCLPACLPACVP